MHPHHRQHWSPGICEAVDEMDNEAVLQLRKEAWISGPYYLSLLLKWSLVTSHGKLPQILLPPQRTLLQRYISNCHCKKGQMPLSGGPCADGRAKSTQFEWPSLPQAHLRCLALPNTALLDFSGIVHSVSRRRESVVCPECLWLFV